MREGLRTDRAGCCASVTLEQTIDALSYSERTMTKSEPNT